MKKVLFTCLVLSLNLGIILFATGLPANCVQTAQVPVCGFESQSETRCSYYDEGGDCYEYSDFLRECDPGEENCYPQNCNISVGCLPI